MVIADLAAVLLILLTLASSLLCLRGWVRLGSTIFIVGILILFMRVTYSLPRLGGLYNVTVVQAVFVASLCVV